MRPACPLLLRVSCSVHTTQHYGLEDAILVAERLAPSNGRICADLFFNLMTESEPVHQVLSLFRQIKRMGMSSNILI
jgi:hypothetical protein